MGDVHGHAEELEGIRDVIRKLASASEESSHTIVYLGDYIDRGPDSMSVLKVLAEGIGSPFQEIFLVGNHDQYLVELLTSRDEEAIDRYFINNWMENGGRPTMTSLGVEGYGRLMDKGDIAGLRARVSTALGASIVDFVQRLQPSFQAGNYLFVHAGIDPARGLAEQDFEDLLLIRRPFLDATQWHHDFCVVHGHSIAKPCIRHHRIGVDAGCAKYGALCAVQLQGDQARFLGVTKRANFAWNEVLGAEETGLRWLAPERID